MDRGEKELNAALAEYCRLGAKTATSLWQTGVVISKMHDRLWQQRRGVDGKRKYKSWNQFVSLELDISIAYANRLRAIAIYFTEEEASRCGAGILMVIARAPKEDRESLLDMAKEGTTKREMELVVAELREMRGVTIMSGADTYRDPRMTPEKMQKAAIARRNSGAVKARVLEFMRRYPYVDDSSIARLVTVPRLTVIRWRANLKKGTYEQAGV